MATRLNADKLILQHPDTAIQAEIEGYMEGTVIDGLKAGRSQREAEELAVGELIFHLLTAGIDVEPCDVWAAKRREMNFGFDKT